MNNLVMNKLSYGLFILTTHFYEKDNGCIINTCMQVTSNPNQIIISVNKDNLTCEMLQYVDEFNVSILSIDASFELFKHFGFQSGKTIDKFENFNDKKRTSNGCYVVTSGTNGYISGHIIKRIDVGTHYMFIAEVTNGELLNDTPSATYTYYHEHIKPQPKKQVETKQTVWRCEICGYEYVGEEVPDDFICPICKHGKEAFKKVN